MIKFSAEAIFCGVVAGASFLFGMAIGPSLYPSPPQVAVTTGHTPLMMGLSGGGWDKPEPTELPSPLSGIYTGTAPTEAARPIASVWCSIGNCALGDDGSVHCTSGDDSLRIETPRGATPNSMPDWNGSVDAWTYRPEDYVSPSTARPKP